MRKYAVWFLVVASFLLKYGSYMTKVFLSVFAGGLLNTVVVDPFVAKYVAKSDIEAPKGQAVNEQGSKERNPEEISQYLELQAMRAFRDLDRLGIEQAVHDAAIKHLQHLAQDHSGILARASKEYFNSDQEAAAFFSKYSIVVDFIK